MNDIWTDHKTAAVARVPRAERTPVRLPGRLTWKDQRGMTRFASVVTRDVSEFGVYVECSSAIPLALYRLVQFQLEASGRDAEGVPAALRNGRVLSAVYRVAPPKPSGDRQGFALRLMIDPRRRAAAPAQIRATA